MKPKRRFSILRRLLLFFFSQKPRKGKGKPSQRRGNSQFNGFSGKSQSYSFVYEHKELDYPVEVFLDEDGNIKEPLEVGTSFKYCLIDRWCMPDCVPGIRSMIDVDGKYFANSCNIIVIFANDKYILISTNKICYIEPDNKYFDIVEAHFVKRGIEHLVDKIPDSNTFIWNNKYGRPNQAISTAGTKPSRRKSTNIKITNHWNWDPTTDFTHTSGSPQNFKIINKTSPGTWVWSEP